MDGSVHTSICFVHGPIVFHTGALLTTIVGIYRHNRKAIEAGRGISRIGEGESFRKAEELLHLELGHALGCPAIEVPSFIAQRLSHLTCQSSSC